MMKVDEKQVDITTSAGTTSYNIAKSSIFEGRKILIDYSQSYSGTIYTTHAMPAFLTKTISWALCTEGNVHDVWKDVLIVGNFVSNGATDTKCKLDLADIPCVGESYSMAFGTTLDGSSYRNYISSIKNFHALCASTASSMFNLQEGLEQAINMEFDGPGNGGTFNATNMFNGCKNLKKVSIKFNCPANISGMFGGCASLTSDSDIVIKSDYPISGSGIFKDCSGLTEMPKFITGWNITSMNEFCYGWGMEEVDDEFIKPLVEGATSFSNMFYNCKKLKKVNFTLPAKINNIAQAFRMCTALTEDNINIKFEVPTDVGSLFYGCTGLTKSPEFIATAPLTRASYLFANCTNLTEATVNCEKLPASSSSVSYMLNGCTKLTKVTFKNVPAGLKSYLVQGTLKCPTTTEIVIE